MSYGRCPHCLANLTSGHICPVLNEQRTSTADMSDTPKFNATEMDIHSPFNACQHRGYCQSLLAELSEVDRERGPNVLRGEKGGGLIEKLCVFCQHWEFYGGEQGYSEYTPGSSASMNCRKGCYGRNFNLLDLFGEDEFRKIITQAGTCPKYEQVANPAS